MINDKIYTPFADIFSLGLIILEIAANIILPDNGTPWRKLSGDLSDAGQLSSDNISMFCNTILQLTMVHVPVLVEEVMKELIVVVVEEDHQVLRILVVIAIVYWDNRYH